MCIQFWGTPIFFISVTVFFILTFFLWFPCPHFFCHISFQDVENQDWYSILYSPSNPRYIEMKRQPFFLGTYIITTQHGIILKVFR